MLDIFLCLVTKRTCCWMRKPALSKTINVPFDGISANMVRAMLLADKLWPMAGVKETSLLSALIPSD
jgi:hypothetical protein